MNREEAKKILRLMRPGEDANDARMQEALALAQTDPALGAWLEAERLRDAALREKMRGIELPVDLLQKILDGKPALPRRARTARQIWLLAASVMVLCGLAAFWFHPAPKNTFAGYERYLGQFVSRKYRMSLETDDKEKIRSFLANNQAPADYALNPKLQETRALGCATLSWNGNPVSMLCFADRANRKVFLFVVNRGAFPDAPGEASRQMQRVGLFSISGWTEGGRSYVLAVEGGEAALNGYL